MGSPFHHQRPVGRQRTLRVGYNISHHLTSLRHNSFYNGIGLRIKIIKKVKKPLKLFYIVGAGKKLFETFVEFINKVWLFPGELLRPTTQETTPKEQTMC